MYDEYAEPAEAIARDEREGLMQAYVQVDRELDGLHEKRDHLRDQIERASERKRDLRKRLGEALGFVTDSASEAAKIKAAFERAGGGR